VDGGTHVGGRSRPGVATGRVRSWTPGRVAGMVVVALLGVGGPPFPAAGQVGPSLDLEPEAGEASSTVTATVAGFDDCGPEDGGPEVEDSASGVEDDGPGSVAFTWTDGRSLGAVTLDAGGSGVSNVLIPEDADAGEATITASCRSDEGFNTSASFTVVPAPEDGDDDGPPEEQPPGDTVEPPEDEAEPPGPEDAGLDEEPGTDGTDGTDDEAVVAVEDGDATAAPWLWVVAAAVALVIVLLLVRALRRAGDVRWARRHVRVVAGASAPSSTHVDQDLDRSGTTLTLRLEPRADPGVSHLEEVP
jgi:hypothetical protein